MISRLWSGYASDKLIDIVRSLIIIHSELFPIRKGILSMGITTFVTLITKDGCFDEFYNLAKEELAFTKQSKGCKSILVSTNRETNTMKMVQFWEDETSYDEYFEKRVERSGADFERLLEGPPEKEHYLTENFGYEH